MLGLPKVRYATELNQSAFRLDEGFPAGFGVEILVASRPYRQVSFNLNLS